MEKYKEILEDISEEVRMVVASLDSEIRQAILVLLSRNAELSFSEIQEQLGLSKMKLNFHLKNLFSSALIDHYYRHEVGSPKYSFYSVSQLGRRVLFNLIQAFIPPSPIARERQPESYLKEYILDHYFRNVPDEAFCTLGEKKEYVVVSSPSGSKAELIQFKISPSSLGSYIRTGEKEI